MFTSTTAALPSKKRVLRGRCLVLGDVENAVGGADMTVAEVVQVRRCVQQAAGLRGDEQVVIGVSPAGALEAGLGWPGAGLRVRSGKDGADLALLEVLTQERVAERFDEVVLVSGDGIFTEAVVALGAAGVKVTVVAHRTGCSKRLRMAASRVVFLKNGAIELEDAA